jgi:hypothetical protein
MLEASIPVLPKAFHIKVENDAEYDECQVNTEHRSGIRLSLETPLQEHRGLRNFRGGYMRVSYVPTRSNAMCVRIKVYIRYATATYTCSRISQTRECVRNCFTYQAQVLEEGHRSHEKRRRDDGDGVHPFLALSLHQRTQAGLEGAVPQLRSHQAVVHLQGLAKCISTKTLLKPM